MPARRSDSLAKAPSYVWHWRRGGGAQEAKEEKEKEEEEEEEAHARKIR